MHHVDEQIIPEIQYKSSYLDSFKFELGMRCDTLEEVLDGYDRLDMIDTLIALDLDSITKITSCKEKEITLILDSLEVMEYGQKDILQIAQRIKADFAGDYINRRLIFKTTGESPEHIEIENGFRGNHIGLIEINGKPSIGSSPFNDEAFDRKLLHITYQQGVYYMKSSGFTNIYRKFIPNEKFSIYPGHRVCFGANVFYLLQYINFSLGEENTVLVKEYTSISELTNVSLYAIIESVGMDPTCKDYIYKNLHEKLSLAAKELKLDSSTTFYKTLAGVIFKAYDDLDMEFMKEFPKKRKYSGAKVLLYLIVGIKLICVNLGDITGHLIISSKLKKTHNIHSIVIYIFIVLLFYFFNQCLCSLSIQENKYENERVKRICSRNCYEKGSQFGATRCFGMFDLKRPPVANRQEVLSESDQNYMWSKPDIFIHNIDSTDDMLIFGNKTFFSQFSPVTTVSSL